MEEVEHGICEFRARIAELRALGSGAASGSSAAVAAVESAIRQNILEIYGKDSHQVEYFRRFRAIDPFPTFDLGDLEDRETKERRRREFFESALANAVNIVAEGMHSLEEFRQELLDAKSSPEVRPLENTVAGIFDRFHSVAHALRTRRGEREPVLINDEYDVQYTTGSRVSAAHVASAPIAPSQRGRRN